MGESDLMDLGVEVHVATEDGTAGYRGMVSELLERTLLKQEDSATKRRVFACGPVAMLKAVAQMAARYEIPAYVSLEERMACGVGACLGCACEVISPEGRGKTLNGPTYKMVCVDGPVFDAQEILWK
jgi:dihydroorotate dehydrogenase electron transfer subunit